DMPKYMNSPETPIYSKSRSLYGLFQSKDAIREKDSVLLVEGYADLISLFQAGFKNVAASSGTALTAEQVQVLGRYTKKFVLLYDADAAGSKAAVRGADIILEQGMDAQVIELPAGYDPDKFIREKGAKEFQKAIDGSISFIDFVTRSFEKEGKLDTPEGQAEAVRTIVQSIAKIDDELKRGFYLKHLSEKYKIYESLLYRELEKTLTGSRRRFSGRQAEDAGSTNATKAGQSAADSRTIPEIPAPERDLLHAMFDGGAEIVRLVQEHVPLELLTNVQSRIIVEHLFAHLEESQQIDPAILIDELDDTLLKQRVSEIVFSKYHLSKNWDARGVIVEEANPFTIARDAINALRKRALEKIIEENQSRIKEGSRRGEDITRYLERHKTLNEEMKELVKGAGNEASAEQSATG
ncbi:MAG TPA: toprim domain-containing protein, partial [Bacteroidota bacterium]|nr:toprim domain-containing protein [Bacteroidota bacterium]